jgi:hypothetical protein
VFENVFKQETGLLISDAVFIYESAAEVLFEAGEVGGLSPDEVCESYLIICLNLMLALHRLEASTQPEPVKDIERRMIQRFLGKMYLRWEVLSSADETVDPHAAIQFILSIVNQTNPTLRPLINHVAENLFRWVSQARDAEYSEIWSAASEYDQVSLETRKIDYVSPVKDMAEMESHPRVPYANYVETLKSHVFPTENEANKMRAWRFAVAYLCGSLTKQTRVVTLEPQMMEKSGQSYRNSLLFQLEWIDEMAKKGFKDWVFSDDALFIILTILLKRGGISRTKQELLTQVQNYFDFDGHDDIRKYLEFPPKTSQEPVFFNFICEFLTQLKALKKMHQANLTLMSEARVKKLDAPQSLFDWLAGEKIKKQLIVGPVPSEILAPVTSGLVRFLQSDLRSYVDPQTFHFDPLIKTAVGQITEEIRWGEFHSVAVPLAQNLPLRAFKKANFPDEFDSTQEPPYLYDNYHSVVFISPGDNDDDGDLDLIWNDELDPDAYAPDNEEPALMASHSNHWTDLITEQAIVFFATLPFYFLLLHTTSYLLSLPAQMGLCLSVLLFLELGSLVFIKLHNRVINDPENKILFQTETAVKSYQSYLSLWYWRIAVGTVITGVITSVGFYFLTNETGSWIALAAFFVGQLGGIAVHSVNWMFKSLWWKGKLKASSSQSENSEQEISRKVIEIYKAGFPLQLSVLRRVYNLIRRLTSDPFKTRQGLHFLRIIAAQGSSGHTFSKRFRRRMMEWGLKYAFDPNLEITDKELDILAGMGGLFFQNEELGKVSKIEFAELTFYFLIRLLIAEIRAKNTKGKNYPSYQKSFRQFYRMMMSRLEENYFMGEIIDPRLILKDLSRGIRKSHPDLANALDAIEFQWSTYGKNRHLLKDPLVSTSMDPQTAPPFHNMPAGNDLSANAVEQFNERQRTHERELILKNALEPDTPGEFQAWNEPINYLVKRAIGNKIISLEPIMGIQMPVNEGLPSSIDFQLAWLEGVAQVGFKDWAVIPPLEFLEPIIDYLREDHPDRLDARSHLRDIEEELSNKRDSFFPDASNFMKGNPAMEQAFLYWEKLKKLRKTSQVNIKLFLTLRGDAGTEGFHFKSWLEKDPSLKKAILGSIVPQRLEDISSRVPVRRFMHLIGPFDSAKSHFIEIEELNRLVTDLGRSFGGGEHKTVVIPVHRRSALLKFLLDIKSGLLNLIAKKNYAIDAIAVTWSHDEGPDRVLDDSPEDDEDEPSPWDSGPGGLELDDEELVDSVSGAAGSFRDDYLESGFDFGETRNLVAAQPFSLQEKKLWIRLQEWVYRLWSGVQQPFYAAAAPLIRTKDVAVFHLDGLVDPMLTGLSEEKLLRNHIYKRVQTGGWDKDINPDVLVIRSNDLTSSQRSIDKLKENLRTNCPTNLHGQMERYLKKAIILVQPSGLLSPTAIMDQVSDRLNRNGFELRFEFYTPFPEQIDSRDRLATFIIYKILGDLTVMPVSQLFENAKRILTHA